MSDATAFDKSFRQIISWSNLSHSDVPFTGCRVDAAYDGVDGPLAHARYDRSYIGLETYNLTGHSAI
eukprot:2712308-Pleurochrysis_carterae.AAC.1